MRSLSKIDLVLQLDRKRLLLTAADLTPVGSPLRTRCLPAERSPHHHHPLSGKQMLEDTDVDETVSRIVAGVPGGPWV